jgi:NAD-dependent dihydropyrimidine dehydrogenase PreA subunit
MYVISSDCVECGACLSACPADAIQEGSPYEITDACTDCGACSDACPVGAISAS